jgi:hypothetical protein
MGIPHKLAKLVHFGALSIELQRHNSRRWESNPLPPRYERKCVYASQVGARKRKSCFNRKQLLGV